MDTDELHFVSYDTEKTWDEMMRVYIECGGDILYPGDEKEMLLRAVLAMTTALAAKIDSALRMDTLTYATGEYLKEYGKKRNCIFMEAIPATAPVTITFITSGIRQIIPAGTQVTADGTVVYETVEDLEQTGTEQVVNTTIRCLTPGSIGNGLRKGTQMQMVENNAAVETLIVTDDAQGGVDEEEEENYRERIRKFGLSSVTTGPADRYESEAMAASNMVLDAKAVNDGPGTVGVYLLLDEKADQNAAVQSVENALSDDTTRPLTDKVEVHLADEAPYTLHVKVWYSTYALNGDAIDSVIAAYRAWQDGRIGRAFNPDRLVAMLYQAGCERVKLEDGSGMGGTTEYKEIAGNAHCKGTITWAVVNT